MITACFSVSKYDSFPGGYAMLPYMSVIIVKGLLDYSCFESTKMVTGNIPF